MPNVSHPHAVQQSLLINVASNSCLGNLLPCDIFVAAGIKQKSLPSRRLGERVAPVVLLSWQLSGPSRSPDVGGASTASASTSEVRERKGAASLGRSLDYRTHLLRAPATSPPFYVHLSGFLTMVPFASQLQLFGTGTVTLNAWRGIMTAE